MCFGTPKPSMFSSARGNAASLDAVENAIRKGCRAAYQNRAMGTRAITSDEPSTRTTHRACAKYNVPTSFPNPNNTPIPFDPIVTAIAAPTPKGAAYITYFVYRNITSATDPAKFTTGCALTPIAEHAAPNRKKNTTI